MVKLSQDEPASGRGRLFRWRVCEILFEVTGAIVVRNLHQNIFLLLVLFLSSKALAGSGGLCHYRLSDDLSTLIIFADGKKKGQTAVLECPIVGLQKVEEPGWFGIGKAEVTIQCPQSDGSWQEISRKWILHSGDHPLSYLNMNGGGIYFNGAPFPPLSLEEGVTCSSYRNTNDGPKPGNPRSLKLSQKQGADRHSTSESIGPSASPKPTTK